jgi:hypothetical protein
MSVKLVPTSADRGCRVVRSTDSYGRILGFPDRNLYFFFHVALELYSRDWVGPVPNPLLLRKSGSAGNWTRTSGSVARSYTDKYVYIHFFFVIKWHLCSPRDRPNTSISSDWASNVWILSVINEIYFYIQIWFHSLVCYGHSQCPSDL